VLLLLLFLLHTDPSTLSGVLLEHSRALKDSAATSPALPPLQLAPADASESGAR
jgi:hypothetical protein